MTPLEAQLAGAHRAHVEWQAHFDVCLICPELNAGQCDEAASLEDRSKRLRLEALAAFDAQNPFHYVPKGQLGATFDVPITLRPPSKVVAHLLEAGAALCGMPGVPNTWPTGHCWTPRTDFREPLPEGWALCPACAAKAACRHCGSLNCPVYP